MQRVLNYKEIKYRSGDVIKATIGFKEIIGVFKSEAKNIYYICHNLPEFEGNSCLYKYGMKYSYYFSNRGGCLSDGVQLGKVLGRVKPNFEICEGIANILNSENIPNILFIDTIQKDYIKFEMSDKKGMIRIFNKKKGNYTEVKFGRFMNLYSKELSSIIDFKELNNKDIENIHNKYLMYQSNNHITVEELSGEDLIEAYNSKNYYMNRYSLGGSCMNDKDEYLKLYTKNPKKVRVMVVKVFDKICGRSLIWTTDRGVEVMDKRYVCEDWVYTKFESIRVDRKMIDFSKVNKSHKATVDISNIKYYPYLDTLYNLSNSRFSKLTNGIYRFFKIKRIVNNKRVLSNTYKIGSIILRSTQGEYST